ncbi:hypothetical protein Tco_0683584, partial [Tanacetum coccineum]
LIFLSSDSSIDEDINEGPSTGRVPKEGPSIRRVPKEGPSIGRILKEGPSIGPSIQGLLEWYEYDNVKEYLYDTYFPSTYKDTTDKDNTDADNIEVSYSPKSEGKYVPVGKRASQKIFFKIPIPVTGCVLGLTNAKTWDEIVKKIGIRKTGNCANK